MLKIGAFFVKILYQRVDIKNYLTFVYLFYEIFRKNHLFGKNLQK